MSDLRKQAATNVKANLEERALKAMTDIMEALGESEAKCSFLRDRIDDLEKASDEGTLPRYFRENQQYGR